LKTWVLLANKGKAIIFSKNKGPKGPYDIKEKFINSSAFKKESDIYSDRSGASRTSYTNNSASLSDSKYKMEQGNKFANEIVRFLDKGVVAKDYDQLIIVSDKGFIGNLRSKIPAQVNSTKEKEILKNFYTEVPHELNLFLKEH